MEQSPTFFDPTLFLLFGFMILIYFPSYTLQDRSGPLAKSKEFLYYHTSLKMAPVLYRAPQVHFSSCPAINGWPLRTTGDHAA